MRTIAKRCFVSNEPLLKTQEGALGGSARWTRRNKMLFMGSPPGDLASAMPSRRAINFAPQFETTRTWPRAPASSHRGRGRSAEEPNAPPESGRGNG